MEPLRLQGETPLFALCHAAAWADASLHSRRAAVQRLLEGALVCTIVWDPENEHTEQRSIMTAAQKSRRSANWGRASMQSQEFNGNLKKLKARPSLRPLVPA